MCACIGLPAFHQSPEMQIHFMCVYAYGALCVIACMFTDKLKPPNMTVTNDGVGVRNRLVLAVLGDCGCVAEAHADEEGGSGMTQPSGMECV